MIELPAGMAATRNVPCRNERRAQMLSDVLTSEVWRVSRAVCASRAEIVTTPTTAFSRTRDKRPGLTLADESQIPPTCRRCFNLRWVCEDHPDQPIHHDDCGGAGVPCPVCNTGRPPAKPQGWRSLLD